MTQLSDQALIDQIASKRGMSLRLESEITNRRGAKLLKLSTGHDFFALKTGSSADSSVAHEAAVLQELVDFNYQIYIDSGECASSSWLLQKWVQGNSVHKQIRQMRERVDDNLETDLLKLFGQMFAKVADLHALGYLHGDLQPNHFRIGGETGEVHLLDFGLAHKTDSKFVYPGAFVHFSAPEICKSQLVSPPANYNQQAEIYSLASTVFFLYTGQISADYGNRDSKRGTLEENRAKIAAGERNTFKSTGCEPFAKLEKILEKCMAFDPVDRYLTMEAAAESF